MWKMFYFGRIGRGTIRLKFVEIIKRGSSEIKYGFSGTIQLEEASSRLIIAVSIERI